MRIEKVGDAIRELLETNEFFQMLMGIIEYVIYTFTVLVCINQFISLGGFVGALFYYLFFVLAILAFAGRNYVGLIILFAGYLFANFFSFIKLLLFAPNHFFSWQHFMGIFLYALLMWFSIRLFQKNTVGKFPSEIPAETENQHDQNNQNS